MEKYYNLQSYPYYENRNNSANKLLFEHNDIQKVLLCQIQFVIT